MSDVYYRLLVRPELPSPKSILKAGPTLAPLQQQIPLGPMACRIISTWSLTHGIGLIEPYLYPDHCNLPGLVSRHVKRYQVATLCKRRTGALVFRINYWFTLLGKGSFKEGGLFRKIEGWPEPSPGAFWTYS